jgi:hypothetical protein
MDGYNLKTTWGTHAAQDPAIARNYLKIQIWKEDIENECRLRKSMKKLLTT